MTVKPSEYAQVFIRCKVPDNIHSEIVALIEELRSIDSTHGYSSPSDLHISVAAFALQRSKVDLSSYEDLILSLTRIASEFQPFEIGVKGLDSFETAIYGKVLDYSKDSLLVMKKRIDDMLNAAEFAEPVQFGASYVPHLTILKFKHSEKGALLNAIQSEPFKSRDLGKGIVKELQIKELNTKNLPNHVLWRVPSFLGKRRASNNYVNDVNKQTSNRIGLTVTRKHEQ